MRLPFKKTLYTTIVFGAGWFGNNIANSPDLGDFDYRQDSQLVLKVQINRGNVENPQWKDYRRIGINEINYSDMSATGWDDNGNHLRASVDAYNMLSPINGLARK